MQGLRLPICDNCKSCRGSISLTVTSDEIAKAQTPKLRQRGRNCFTTGGRIVRKRCKYRAKRRCCQEDFNTPKTWWCATSYKHQKQRWELYVGGLRPWSPDLGAGGFAFEAVHGVCALGCRDSVRGVRAKQCRDHPRKKLPPTNFEFSPKVLRNPRVVFAKSRSSFGEYFLWSDITKVLQIPSTTALFWRFCSGCLRNSVVIIAPLPAPSRQKQVQIRSSSLQTRQVGFETS